MKQKFYHTLICLFIVSGITNMTYGQCNAEAGENAALCTHWGLDTFYLGGTPTVLGGTPPYTYKWTCYYSNLWFSYTASHFLDDTTLANPRLIQFADTSLTFHLEVIDATGFKCTDSIILQFSRYIVTLGVNHAEVHQGDSAKLYTSVYGGIPPITYLWSPSTGLTDPTDVYTWAKPDSSIVYHLLVTDSAGCQIEDIFYFTVYTTAVNELHRRPIESIVIPNPLIDVSSIVVSPLNATSIYQIFIYDINGRFRKKLAFNNGRAEIHKSDFGAGIYFFQVFNGKEIITNGKFAVQ